MHEKKGAAAENTERWCSQDIILHVFTVRVGLLSLGVTWQAELEETGRMLSFKTKTWKKS